MSLASHNAFVSRIAAGYYKRQHIRGDRAAVTATLIAGTAFAMQKTAYTQVMPGSLPTGVTAFVPTSAAIVGSSGSPHIIGKLVDLGDFNNSTNTFTDGDDMPDQTVGNGTVQLPSTVIMEVTTALNSDPGTLSVTYVDQNGNAAEATTTAALTASAVAGTCSVLPLNAGDWGVLDLTAAVRASGSSHAGAIQFWGFIPLGVLFCTGSDTPGFLDLLTTTLNPMRLGINDQIGLFQLGAVALAAKGYIELVGDT